MGKYNRKPDTLRTGKRDPIFAETTPGNPLKYYILRIFAIQFQSGSLRLSEGTGQSPRPEDSRTAGQADGLKLETLSVLEATCYFYG